ncbi:MAG TPA: HupE/UreJ family protein [Gaiellaceae bacterium]|nr:HupE/UreJ family protein [Gaiellaceae bacterium]
MFGLDERIAAASNGASIWIVLAVAVLLGLRHATDPDHLAAVTTLVASGRERAARRAGELGLAWGLGHATTLFAFGLPILLLNSFLPQWLQQVAETAIGFVIVYLALRLLLRWRRGELRFHAHPHAHGARTRRAAFAIGLVHGMAGSAGVGVLVLASVRTTDALLPLWARPALPSGSGTRRRPGASLPPRSRPFSRSSNSAGAPIHPG